MTVPMNRFALLAEDADSVEERTTLKSTTKQVVGKPGNVKATISIERPAVFKKKETSASTTTTRASKTPVADSATVADYEAGPKRGVKRDSKSKQHGDKREHDRRNASGLRDSQKKMNAEKGSWGHELQAQETAEEVKEILKDEDAAVEASGSVESLEAAAEEEEEAEPEIPLKTLEQFLQEKTKITSHFVSRSANEGVDDSEWKGLAKLQKDELTGVFVELQVEKSKKQSNNKKSADKPASPALDLGFHSGKREERPFNKRPPFNKESGGERKNGGAAAAGGNRRGEKGRPFSGKPQTQKQPRVNVADDKAFPSLA